MKLDAATLSRAELHDVMGSAIAPLPIAFISTVGPDGSFNAAPFSFITPVCSKPPIICVSIGLRAGQKKDTLKNIEFARDFVINTVDEGIIKQAVQASADYPYGIDEMKATGLTAVKSEMVKSPRIAEARVNLECRLVQKLELMEEYPEGPGLRGIVFGQIVMIHVKDEVWVDGKIDPRRLKPVGRLGNNLYFKPTDIFELKASKI